MQVHDTETRNLDPGPAGEIVRSVSSLVALESGARPPFFKKVDSTLRGNVGAEVLAAAGALGFSGVVLAPALPNQGRTVIEGRLLVDGIPVTRTAAGRDPRKPVTSDLVGEILGLQVHRVGLAQVREGGDFLSGLTQSVVVVDCMEDSDLAAVAAALSTRPDLLPAGSAGLASAIAVRQCGLPPDVLPGPVAAVLVVVGSANPVSREQAGRLRRAQLECVTVLDVADVGLAEPTQMVRALAGRAVSCLASLPIPVAVVATGGDMTLAICEAMGEDTIWTCGEVLPGIPWGTLENSGAILVSKAGGFGGRESLVDTARLLLGSAVRGQS